jgi:hypothetical protein
VSVCAEIPLVVKATKIPIEDEDYEEGLELPHP